MADRDPIAAVMDGGAWDDFCDHLRRAGRLVIDAAPDDAFDRAEGLRYVGRVAKHALQSFIEERDPASPVLSGLPKLGGDNPDYVYTAACLSGAYEYSLRGRLGEVSYLGMGTYSGEVGTEAGLRGTGYLAGDALETDADGRFEVRISCEKRPGNWLAMTPQTSQLMIRELLLDRRRNRPSGFEIQRVGGSDAGLPLDPRRYATQIDLAGGYVEGAIAQFLEWSQAFARHRNQVRPLDEKLAVAAQGDPNTHYYGGYYEIAADEVLLIDLIPPPCEYWNLQLCNHWLESLDYWKHTVSVNHHTAVPRDDGSVRLVVAPSDPRAANWLDTAGHRRGGIFLRWVGTPDPYDPACRVVKLAAAATQE